MISEDISKEGSKRIIPLFIQEIEEEQEDEEMVEAEEEEKAGVDPD